MRLLIRACACFWVVASRCMTSLEGLLANRGRVNLVRVALQVSLVWDAGVVLMVIVQTVGLVRVYTSV